MSPFRFRRAGRMFLRRHPLLVALAAGGLLTSLSWYLPAITSLVLTLTPVLNKYGHPSSTGGYCEIDDIAQGTWREDREFDNYEQIYKAYGLHSRAGTTCEVPPDKLALLTGDSIEDAKFRRIKEVAIPALQPRGSCTMHALDARMILQRLLRSPAGLTIVGDSISQYTFNVWEDILQSVEPGLVGRTKVNDHHYVVNMSPSHPSTDAILRSAGVSPSRLAIPIVAFYRSDYLVPAIEVPSYMPEESLGRLKIKTQNDAAHWFPLFEESVRQAHLKLKDDLGMYDETTLLIISTGAHWNVGEFGGGIEEDEFVAGFRNVFLAVSANVTGLPFPVSAFWRSLAPAHVDCVVSTTLNNARSDWSSPLNGHMNMWNYQWYTWMNVIGRRHAVHTRNRADWNFKAILAKEQKNPPMRYFNVWDMSLKRPEAHLRPPKDCLHWCMIGPMNYWQQLVWNMIVQESNRNDYDVAPSSTKAR